MQKIRNFKKIYHKCKFIKITAFLLYCFLPIIEMPAWCIQNPKITNQRYCQD